MVPDDDSGWVRFWECYPRREAKLDARKAWAQLGPSSELVDQIIQALGWQRQSDQWLRGFIPLPATYLRGRRFDDERSVALAPVRRQMSDGAATVFETLTSRRKP